MNTVDVEAIRQQATVARAQAIATLATLDALLSTLPAAPRAAEAKRMAYMGMEDEPQETT